MRALTMFRIVSAVPQGTVDFSTTILSVVAAFAMFLVAFSTKPRSAALPLPSPLVLVGVLTHKKIKSAVSNGLVDIGGKEQVRLTVSVTVPISSCGDDFVQSRFEDRKSIRIPGLDPRGIQIDYSDFDLGVVCDDSRRGPSYKAGA